MKVNFKYIIFFFLCLSLSTSYSQGEAAYWYFGDHAGLYFDPIDGSVTPLNDGQLSTREGCSTISDEFGNLLFYTDGITVWNRNHGMMSNGNGLYGDPSSTHSAIIIPKPEDANTYYIFTVDTSSNEGDTNFGLNFSEVDMTLDSGLGGIVLKNQGLLAKCSEKVTAVLRDCETQAIWVVTFASLNGDSGVYNTFHAFEVTTAGVNTTSIKSNFGIDITDNRGSLKFSPNGKKLACANMKGSFDADFVAGGLFLYDFDVTTGLASNQQGLIITSSSKLSYGVAFSPNSQVLYVNSTSNTDTTTPTPQTTSLIQFDLLAPDIQATQLVIDERPMYRGALQLALNGKIYRALSETYTEGTSSLGAINNPNEIGLACNYEHNAINLAPNESSQGLPPFIQSFFNEKIDIINNNLSSEDLALCDGQSFTLTAPDLVDAVYTWIHDGVTLPDDTYSLEIFDTGFYQVIVEQSLNCGTLEGDATVTITGYPDGFDSTLIQCDDEGIIDGITTFDLFQAQDDLTGSTPFTSVKFYEYLIDAQDDINEVDGSDFSNTTNPQTIFAQVIDDTTNCYVIVELTLDVSTSQIDDYYVTDCDDIDSQDGFNTFDLDAFTIDIQAINGIVFPITYFASYSDALLEQNQLATPFTNTIPYDQTIYTRVEETGNCYAINEVILHINPLPQLIEDETVFYCLNFFPETITIESGVIGNPDDYTYSWSNGETTNEIEVNQVGAYTVTVTNALGCSQIRIVTVEASNIATIDDIEIVDASSNNTITVLVSGEGQYEYALFEDEIPYTSYQESNVFTNVAPGFYIVSVRDIKKDCGITQVLVGVIGFPKFFTPNNDGKNDYWQVKGVSELFQPNTKIKIFNRFGKLLKELSPLSRGWDGTFNGKVLQNDDYWFAVTLQDGREVTNHFTLKR